MACAYNDYTTMVTTDKMRRVNPSTALQSLIKVSHSGYAMPITPDYYPKVERIDCAQQDDKFSRDMLS